MAEGIESSVRIKCQWYEKGEKFPKDLWNIEKLHGPQNQIRNVIVNDI